MGWLFQLVSWHSVFTCFPNYKVKHYSPEPQGAKKHPNSKQDFNFAIKFKPQYIITHTYPTRDNRANHPADKKNEYANSFTIVCLCLCQADTPKRTLNKGISKK